MCEIGPFNGNLEKMCFRCKDVYDYGWEIGNLRGVIESQEVISYWLENDPENWKQHFDEFVEHRKYEVYEGK